jgi:Flp pilus assembly protein TadD
VQRIAQFVERRAAWVAVGGIVVLGLLAYLPSLSYPYVQDAVDAVERNPVIERGDAVEIFGSHYWKDTPSNARNLYRPVTLLTFAWEKRLAGELSSMVSRAVNLLLHLGNATLLFFYCRRLGGAPRLALLASWLFAVHPLLLQGVINVVGRADLLALLFSLGALLAMTGTGSWRGAAAPAPERQRWASWCTGACVFLALCSKEIALATPVLLVVQELLFRGNEILHQRDAWWRRIAALAPSVLAGLFFIHLRTQAIGVFPGLQIVPPEDNVLVGLDGLARLSTALAMAARYAGLLLFPAKLSPDYSGTTIGVHGSPLNPASLSGSIFLAALLALALLPWLRRAPNRDSAEARDRRLVISMGAWLFLLPYLLVGNLLTLNAAGFAERLLYFPGAGFCIVVASLLAFVAQRWPRLAPALLIGFGVALVGCIYQVHSEGRMWESRQALFAHALSNTPRSLRANMARAHAHRRREEPREAQHYFERCVEFAPDDPGSWSDLGIMLAHQNKLERAEEVLRRALELDPTRAEAHAYLGMVFRRTGRLAEADRSLRKALVYRPDMASAAAELGHLYFGAGRFRRAAYYYRGAVQLGREDLIENLRRAEEMVRKRMENRQ